MSVAALLRASRNRPPDRAARCAGCGERLGATHQPGCPEGTAEVIHADTAPPYLNRDPGPDRPPFEEASR